MTKLSQAVREIRGFEWRLAALQRKLEWELDAARTESARRAAAWEAASAGVRAAEDLLQQAAGEARRAVAASADPRAHRRALGYLVSLGDQVAVAAAKEQEAGEALGTARQQLMRRQRRLEVLLRARQNALDAHLRDRARREQAEADAGWLALRELRRTAPGAEGHA